jgi:hypothetical protein
MRFPPQDGRGRRGRGPGGRRQAEPPTTTADELAAWFTGSLPDGWFTGPVTVTFDRDEILVTGNLAAPNVGDNPSIGIAEQARIDAFRDDTRDQRMAIAQRAQHTFHRVVSWAATCGDTEVHFTVANVPVMTRLRMENRATLDTLIDAGVARSRSEALAWCVQMVADNEAEWLGELRSAMSAVDEARAKGPAASRNS